MNENNVQFEISFNKQSKRLQKTQPDVKLVRGQNVFHINYALWFLPLKYQMTVITHLNFIESKEVCRFK